MNTPNEVPIDILADRRWLPTWGTLLSRGVALRVATGTSVRELLCGQLNVEAAYLEKRIQTIFLNGHPVDDIDGAVVGDGAVLAISAAMPGLVGAVMRRGGRYAPLRRSISYHAGAAPLAQREGTVQLKLFNLVGRELGPAFLSRGVLLAAGELEAFVVAQPADFRGGIRGVRLDGRAVSVTVLDGLASQAETLRLTVAAD